MAWLGEYQYRRAITLDYTKFPSDLTDFPLMVKLTDANFDFSKFLTTNDLDIRFTSSDGETLLKFEKELKYYNSDTSQNEAVYWVKIPTASSSINTVIYVYYGLISDADGSDASNVWDSYHKAVYHLQQTGNGTAGEFIDSKNGYNGQGGGGTAGKIPSPSLFIAKGQSFDGSDDYIQISDESNLELGSNDLTISLKAKFNSGSGNDCFLGRATNGNSYFYFAHEGGTGTIRFRDYDSNDIIDFYTVWSPTPDTVYDIEVTRSGNTWHLYVDGVSKTLTLNNGSYSATILDRSEGWEIGGNTVISYFVSGLMDEVRISIGLDRGSAWRTARINSDNNSIITIGSQEEGTAPLEVSIGEIINISDTWNIQSSADLLNIAESIVLADSWGVSLSVENLSTGDTITLEDAWEILRSKEPIDTSDTVRLLDEWVINLGGAISSIISTQLYTVFSSATHIFTDLRIGIVRTYIYATELYLQLIKQTFLKTDCRVKSSDYDSVQVGSFDDYSIKLDGVSLNRDDVDYSSVSIYFNLNSTPSRAEFILPRHHDNLDKKLDGSTSVITNLNKIEIYDGTTKLFTGYITQINADSNRDVVQITAEDVRYKMALQSIEIKYGGDWLQDSNSNGIPDIDDPDHVAINQPSYIHFQKNIATAINEVISNIGGLITGYDALPFSGSFVPEYTKKDDNLAALLDELIRNTANVNWYTDANERLRYQVIANGQIKTLNLSSLNLRRHPYDTILNDIQLNKKPASYCQSLIVKRGNHIIKQWARNEFSGWMNSIPEFLNSVREKTIFDFQQWGEVGVKFYVGINQTIYGYFAGNSQGWILKPTIDIQWLQTDRNFQLSDITVGAGSPTKTLYLTSYGIKEENAKWEEQNKTHEIEVGGQVQRPHPDIVDAPYLCVTTVDTYDRTGFCLDLANFELSQNNKLTTTATVTLLLDAFKYYNISMSDMINLSNTLQSNIYNNNNGFPLNITSIQINFSKRTVTLSLTNYGKSYYAKSANYMVGYYAPTISYWMKKMPVQRFTQGL